MAGEIDTIELLQNRDIHDVIEAIKVQAIDKAIKAGADPGSYSCYWVIGVAFESLLLSTATTKIVEVVNLPVQVRLLKSLG